MVRDSKAKPSADEASPPVADVKPPVAKANPPVAEEKPPVVESKPPVVQARTPVVETRPPIMETKPPVVETKPPVVESKPPVVQARTPAVESKPPVVQAKPSVAETKPPVAETKPPVVETKPPVVETKPPVVETKPPVVETKPPVVEAKPPVVETKPPVVEPKPPLLEDFPPEIKSDDVYTTGSFTRLAEAIERRQAARHSEDHLHASGEDKSDPQSSKSQKKYLLVAVIVLLIAGIIALQLDQKKAYAQLQKLLSLAGLQKHADGKEGAHTTHDVDKTSGKDVALSDEEAQTVYEVSKPLVKNLTMNDEYVCQIRAIQHIEVRSLERGYLQNVLVDEGQNVHQGQLLFQIKPSIYQADVHKEEAEYELSKIELQNNQALADKDIISSTEAAMSAAKLAKVQAELELAKTHLGFTEIRAPFNGLIGRFGDIRVGSLLEENQLLTTLSDTHRLWVYFNVPEGVYLDYMQHKHKGGPQKVQLELANKQIYPEPGTIEVIQSDFSSTSGNIAFRASFSNPQALLRYGQTGKILWPNSIQNAVMVPQKSTFEILDKRFVYVVDKAGIIHEREIKVEHEEPHIYLVSAGIAPGEMFLLERQNKLDKGDKIKFKLIDPQHAIDNLKLYAE